MKNANEKPKLPHDSLISLDDPLEVEIENAPSTKRPAVDPDAYARHVESAEMRATQPPSATYEMLRDSCKAIPAADDILLDESAIHTKDGERKMPVAKIALPPTAKRR
jgi:hypothetical protein